MDPAKQKPKYCLYRHSSEKEEGGAWARLLKVLGSISETEIKEIELAPNIEELESIAKSFDHIFLDINLVNISELSSKHIERLTILQNKAIDWKQHGAEEKYGNLFETYPSLVLNDLPPGDLLRLLHIFLYPRRISGVPSMMEKNSIILGEKVQTLDSIGILTDKLCGYFEKVDNFYLKNKIPDLRQILTSLLIEAFQKSREQIDLYPTVDFQVSASTEKLSIGLRFPLGAQKFESIPQQIVKGNSLSWNIIWQNSDVTHLTFHEQHNEIEVLSILSNTQENTKGQYRSLLWKTLAKSAKKESLLSVPQNYTFQLISEIRSKEFISTSNQEINSIETPNDILTREIPESVQLQISNLKNELGLLNEKNTKDNAQIIDLSKKLDEANRELNKKRSELIRISKTNEIQQKALKNKVEELELKITKALTNVAPTQQNKDGQSISELQDTISRLEASVRATENDKSALSEKIAQEQKRIQLYEQKYATAHRENLSKEKEIQELKAMLLKSKKEKVDGANNQSSGANGSPESTNAKLKELENRETALKQELRKTQFKLDSQEKNLKAIQNETGEKAKLMEQKLQAAKTKELELLKKIEDLSNALKKAAKAA